MKSPMPVPSRMCPVMTNATCFVPTLRATGYYNVLALSLDSSWPNVCQTQRGGTQACQP